MLNQIILGFNGTNHNEKVSEGKSDVQDNALKVEFSYPKSEPNLQSAFVFPGSMNVQYERQEK